MRKEPFFDIAVIGAGASGLAAAISAKKTSEVFSVAVFETNQRAGKKLITTGNGQCNLSNKKISKSHYHGNEEFAIDIIRDGKTAEKFFEELSIITVSDGRGRMYPYSRQASAVIDALRFECEKRNVEIFCQTQIESVKKISNGFELNSKDKVFYAKKLILSTGSNASVPFSNGYNIAKSLGHTCTRLFPAIVQLKTDITPIKAFKGIKTDANVKIVSGGKILAENRDELLFTEYGISGPAVMYISRAVSADDAKKTAVIDFCPDIDFDKVMKILTERRDNLGYREKSEFLNGFLNKRIGQMITQKNVSGEKVCDIKDGELQKICRRIKGFELEITGTKGFENAQATAGGIPVFELNNDLSSKKCENLYITGELADIDGDCGGYNLLWAFTSGIVAGSSAAKTEIK